MAIDYSSLWAEQYRRKGLTGVFPSSKQYYATLAPVLESKRREELIGGQLAETKRANQAREALVKEQLEMEKRQALFQNVSDTATLAYLGHKAWKYGQKPESTGLGPDRVPMENARPYTETALVPAAPQAGVPMANAAPWTPPGQIPFTTGAGAGAGGELVTGGVASPTSLAPVTPPPTTPTVGAAGAMTPYSTPWEQIAAEAPVKQGLFSYAEGSMAAGIAESSGGLAAGAATGVAGVAGSIAGHMIGSKIAKVLGTHEKTTSDVASAVAVFGTVTAMTGNPVIGFAAAAVDAIFSMF